LAANDLRPNFFIVVGAHHMMQAAELSSRFNSTSLAVRYLFGTKTWSYTLCIDGIERVALVCQTVEIFFGLDWWFGVVPTGGGRCLRGPGIAHSTKRETVWPASVAPRG
jgi:hypothetical protein